MCVVFVCICTKYVTNINLFLKTIENQWVKIFFYVSTNIFSSKNIKKQKIKREDMYSLAKNY